MIDPYDVKVTVDKLTNEMWIDYVFNPLPPVPYIMIHLAVGMKHHTVTETERKP